MRSNDGIFRGGGVGFLFNVGEVIMERQTSATGMKIPVAQDSWSTGRRIYKRDRGTKDGARVNPPHSA